jgi:flavin-dependent dehydrogenase
MIESHSSAARSYDVVICGGGLSGLLLARQLRREMPQLSVLVLEWTKRPLPDACHKVGESSVELGCQHLERMGLTEYLLEKQLVKFALRFFPGGGKLPVEQRTEIGPANEPVVRSYQVDRGRLETDLRAFIEQDGATLIEGAKVERVDHDLPQGRHRVTYVLAGVEQHAECRWVVDASGRAALLRRAKSLTRASRHAASASWFRIAGKFDINRLVPESSAEWHRRPNAKLRWRSTNHFMGPGYWAWVIPLSTGNTSIGLVTHDAVHDPRIVMRLDRTMDFLREHEPVLAAHLEHEEVKDFLCLRQYSHNVARAWSEERWAMVGEAGAFVDPLYSPGTDFISLANNFTCEMIRTDLAGGDLKAKAEFLNLQYRALVASTIGLFADAAPVYGHPTAMAAKVCWDNFLYWSYTCQYSQRQLYRLAPDEFAPFGSLGRRFLELSSFMQRALRRWAEIAPREPDGRFVAIPTYPSVMVDAHIAIGKPMTLPETRAYLERRLVQAEELAGELMLRMAAEIGPEKARDVLEHVHFATWNVSIPPERLAAEQFSGIERRRKLSEVVRDVERTLGAVHSHHKSMEARELVVRTAGARADVTPLMALPEGRS